MILVQKCDNAIFLIYKINKNYKKNNEYNSKNIRIINLRILNKFNKGFN